MFPTLPRSDVGSRNRLHRRRGALVDSPSERPPTNAALVFRLSENRQGARLTIPPTLLARAEVIE
jgi:hypothetical protein